MDDPVRAVSVVTKTWQRLLEGDIVDAFFDSGSEWPSSPCRRRSRA